MAPRTWTNGGGTPLSAANLNALEAELAAKADKTDATTSVAGLMSTTDKAKVDALIPDVAYSFEDGTLGGVVAQSATAGAATPEARSGLYSAILTSNSTTADSTLIFPEFTVQEGRTYRLTAYAKLGTGTGHSLRMGGAYIAPDGSSTFASTLGGTPLSSSAYTPVTRDVTIPSRGAGLSGYKAFKPRLTSQNARVVGYIFYIDDVTFTDITDVSILASTAVNGLMSAADKTKLDNATAATSNSTVVMRDANGNTGFDRVLITDPPTAADHGTRKDYVDALNAKGYRAYAMSAEPSAFPVGITNFLASTTDGWVFPSGEGFGQVVTIRQSFSVGGTIQLVSSYIDDVKPMAWRVWENAALAWGPWQIVATKDYVDTGLSGRAPTQSAANTTYFVATTGSDANTGLTSGAPFLTIQKAVDVAAATSLGNDKVAIITVAAGTYAGRVVFPAFTENRLNVTIQGPEIAHPGVPTVIQTEGATAAAVGFFSKNPNNTIKVRNIKFVGYRNSTASGGITVANGGYLFTENCHFTDCYWGISGQTAQIDVKGGIFEGCGYLGISGSGSGAGVRSLQLNQHAIGTQGAGNLNSGPIFKNSNAGVFAQELSTGHVDWCTIQDCTTGLNLAVNARVNSDGTSFKRNSIDIRVTSGANVYLTANNVFGTGVDESSVKFLVSNGATINDDYRMFTNILQSNGGTYRSADTVFPNTTVTAQVTQAVYTATLGAGLWRQDASSLGLGRKLNVKIYGTLNGTLGVKDVTVRLGTALVSPQFTAAEAGGFEAEATIFFTGKATQLLSMRAYKHLGGSMRVSTASGTNALTADTNLTVEARAGTAGDSVLISAIELNWA